MIQLLKYIDKGLKIETNKNEYSTWSTPKDIQFPNLQYIEQFLQFLQ